MFESWRDPRAAHAALLLLSAATLVAGLGLHAAGRPDLALLAWWAGALPVGAVLAASVARGLWRREAGVDVLALLAIGLALVLGETLTAAVIALMLASGRALEAHAEARARREMTALLRHAPRRAHRLEGAEWRVVELDAVDPGDRLLVPHGEVVPVDGVLTTAAELDESALTGEARPAVRAAGESVASGVLNAGAALEMTAAARADASTFAGIVRMVSAAQRERAPAVRLADRYAGGFVALALLGAGGAWLWSGDLTRALAVLVVATPCPLILAVPVAIVSGMSGCARRGVLVKGGGALERLARADQLFFDKTGTLTAGRARLTDIAHEPAFGADEVLGLAAALAQASGHVASEAVVAAARERGLALAVPGDVRESAGAGVSGMVQGHQVAIGSIGFVSRQATPAPWSEAFLRRSAFEGASPVFVGVDGAMVGALRLLDRIRLETPRALRLLRREGVRRIVMLTGDRAEVAAWVGGVLGGLEVLAGQTPADKLAAIRAARDAGTVIMVGDGVNDAPALAAADVGVAMGARGAAASSEAADVVLLVDRLDRLVDARRIAQHARRIALQSVAAGMGLSAAAMVAAGFGLLPPLAGAVLQEAIDVAVILNALRALRPPRVVRRAPALDPSQAGHLRAEHAEMATMLDDIRGLAQRLPGLPGERARAELAALCDTLTTHLLPHELYEDAEIYPVLGEALGGDDPMAALSATHREIFRRMQLLAALVGELPVAGPDAESARELQQQLYGLDAIVRLHVAQEDELFHALDAGAPAA